jgi:hypothetical protein
MHGNCKLVTCNHFTSPLSTPHPTSPPYLNILQYNQHLLQKSQITVAYPKSPLPFSIISTSETTYLALNPQTPRLPRFNPRKRFSLKLGTTFGYLKPNRKGVDDLNPSWAVSSLSPHQPQTN